MSVWLIDVEKLCIWQEVVYWVIWGEIGVVFLGLGRGSGVEIVGDEFFEEGDYVDGFVQELLQLDVVYDGVDQLCGEFWVDVCLYFFGFLVVVEDFGCFVCFDLVVCGEVGV